MDQENFQGHSLPQQLQSLHIQQQQQQAPPNPVQTGFAPRRQYENPGGLGNGNPAGGSPVKGAPLGQRPVKIKKEKIAQVAQPGQLQLTEIHYVMQIVFNPKDNNTFASASLDRTVKVWQLGSNFANFTLEGHEKGVNCIDYYHGGDKPYLISGADDRLVKIWDYQNKTCVQTLEGHAQNISAVCFHPELPIVLTGSEDGTVRIWHSGTYRLETCLNYGFERVWTISSMRGTNNVALGYDEGSIIIKVGREEPAMSMDVVGGKIIWAKHSEMQQVSKQGILCLSSTYLIYFVCSAGQP